MYCTVRPTREDSLARHRRGSTSVFLRQVRITSMGAKGWLRSGRKRMTQRGMRIPWVWPSKTRMEPGADEAAASPALNSLMVGERGAAAAAAVAAAAAADPTAASPAETSVAATSVAAPPTPAFPCRGRWATTPCSRPPPPPPLLPAFQRGASAAWANRPPGPVPPSRSAPPTSHPSTGLCPGRLKCSGVRFPREILIQRHVQGSGVRVKKDRLPPPQLHQPRPCEDDAKARGGGGGGGGRRGRRGRRRGGLRGCRHRRRGHRRHVPARPGRGRGGGGAGLQAATAGAASAADVTATVAAVKTVGGGERGGGGADRPHGEPPTRLP
ncbi:hypothetical protein I4F81_007606 [Pyropia yezoensis]|uniref:Uncharacterized protein n=1 Tax=Pyropia yezoensis TaxID=2788 RepID=A0ACC3C5P4_PYRYE|nr:hypothetical protein I4F81_007606 [Neopyropia yezoensis]